MGELLSIKTFSSQCSSCTSCHQYCSGGSCFVTHTHNGTSISVFYLCFLVCTSYFFCKYSHISQWFELRLKRLLGRKFMMSFLPAVVTNDLLIGSYTNYITSFFPCLNSEINELFRTFNSSIGMPGFDVSCSIFLSCCMDPSLPPCHELFDCIWLYEAITKQSLLTSILDDQWLSLTMLVAQLWEPQVPYNFEWFGWFNTS